MTKAEIQSLLDGDSCYSCYGSPAEVLNLLLLKQWLLAINPLADTSPETLLSGCLSCLGPQGDQLEIALLGAIAQTSMTKEAIQALIDEAECLNCFANASSADLVKLALLARIMAALEA